VVHFEIPVDDPERARRFYEEAFSWRIMKWEGPVEYWLVTTGESPEPGIDGGLSLRENLRQVTNTLDVANLDEAIAKVEKAGGRVVVPKDVVPGVGYTAYCQDTEGNLFGMIQEDTGAH
jgi:predicted enzyme related to lactoylglutathione lyase